MKNTVVLTYGKGWSDLLVKDRSAFHTVYPLARPGFCIPQKDFEKIASEDRLSDGHTEAVWQMLTEPSSAASTLVNRISFYVKNSDIVLIDTDYLDSALGHEIIRTAYTEKKPCYAVGVSANTSTVAPYYVAGIWYPSTTADIWKLVDLAVPRFVPEEAKELIKNIEKMDKASDAMETL